MGSSWSLKAKAHGSSLRATLIPRKECSGDLGVTGESRLVPLAVHADAVGLLLRVSGPSGYSLLCAPQLYLM